MNHDLLFVAANGPDHLLTRSIVAQFIEAGIDVDLGPEDGLHATVPAELDRYRAVLLDPPAAQQALDDPATATRLEALARRGFVFCLADPSQSAGHRFFQNILRDAVNFEMMLYVEVHAALKRHHPAMAKRQLARPDAAILDALAQNLRQRLATMHNWSEDNLHCWQAARRLISHGCDDLRPLLVDAIRRCCHHLRDPGNHDVLAGFFAVAWLRDQTGETEPLDRVRAIADRVIAERPRMMGVLNGSGYESDPLGLRLHESTDLERHYSTHTTVRRDVMATEVALFHLPLFASLYRATGEQRYLDECVCHVELLEQTHLRSDGLLAHAVRDRQQVAGAWGRGQAHALNGLVYMLHELDRAHPLFERGVRIIDRVARALQRHQDPTTGLWRNLIDFPSARLESSCTASFAHVLGVGVNEGWLDRDTFEPTLRHAWNGLKRVYYRGGFCAACRGSAWATDDAYYLARPQGWNGAQITPYALMAGMELHRLGGEHMRLRQIA